MAAKRADALKLRPKQELTIALDDLDFSWFPEQVQKVKEMWNKGASITEIAKVTRPANELKTPEDAVDEVALLIMHLQRQKEILPRAGGVWGKGG